MSARTVSLEVTVFRNVLKRAIARKVDVAVSPQTLPGELFVHRNVANVVVHTDLNCLSVMQFAVDILRVQHIIVCGHYGCGGVRAVLCQDRLGLVDNWLRRVQDVRQKHKNRLLALPELAQRLDRLCELNVIEQVLNVCHTSIVRDAWQRGQSLAVHGWIYGLKDGLLRDLDTTVTQANEATARYREALSKLSQPLDPVHDHISSLPIKPSIDGNGAGAKTP
jgi:carbonic anhydrase